jgi:thiol:disulfide interchange protein DsbD
MFVRVFRLLLLVALCALPAALRAQVKVSLHALKSTFPADAAELMVGLRIEHEPKWHTYWLQPGTGLPTSIEWQLPPGWSAGPIRWPAPMRVYDTAKNLAGNGYEGVVFLPVALTPPRDLAPDTPVTLRAKVEWLMCKDVCIPGDAELELTLTPTAPGAMTTANVTDSPAGEALLATIDALPVPLPEGWTARVTRADPAAKTLRLRLTPPATAPPAATLRALGEPWFFAADAAVAYDRPQSRAPRAAAGEIDLLLPVADYAPAGLSRLVGVITFAKGAAFELDLPIEIDPADSALGAAGASSGASAAGPASLGGVLLLAFVGGLILNLMPCVFPVLGLKVMGFVQQAGHDRARVTAHGLVFTLGVLLSFWALAGVLAALRAGGTQLGWGFQLQEPAFVFAMAAVLLAFALNMSGAFEFALRATSVGGALQRKGGYAGSFFTGVLATVVATPCSAPFLAPALGAALALPVATSFAVFTAIALGLAAPYLALSVFPAAIRVLPRPGAWMETFKQGMAFLLYATVVLLVWILAAQLGGDELLAALLGLTAFAFALWLYGRATAPAAGRRPFLLGVALLLGAGALGWGWPRAASPDALVWEPWSAERVAELRAEGRPIYVDFTARWCFTCQTNKKAVFAGPGSGAVLKAFRDQRVAALRADWTNRDPLISAELARWGRAAVPFNLLYLPDREEPRVLPELLTPGIVLDALRSPAP